MSQYTGNNTNLSGNTDHLRGNNDNLGGNTGLRGNNDNFGGNTGRGTDNLGGFEDQYSRQTGGRQNFNEGTEGLGRQGQGVGIGHHNEPAGLGHQYQDTTGGYAPSGPMHGQSGVGEKNRYESAAYNQSTGAGGARQDLPEGNPGFMDKMMGKTQKVSCSSSSPSSVCSTLCR